MSKKNAILAAVEGYDFAVTEVFLNSLKKTSFDGDLILFVNNLSSETISKIRAFRPIIIKYDRLEGHLIHNYRFFLFKNFLEEHRKQFASILLTDLRDVVFQSDPFYGEDYIDRLCTFYEDKKFTIKETPQYNAKWVKDALGEKALAKIENNNIVCAGTILGSVDKILEYLDLYSQLFNWSNVHLPLDQGIINYICHRKLLDGLEIINNNEGAVCTMAHMKNYLFEYPFVRREDGSIVNILHQYDRHKELQSHFSSFFSS